MPTYPAPVLAAGIVGEAQVTFELKEDGSVTRPKIARSTHPEFGEAALVGVNQWKFKPLKWISQPKAVEVTATFVFSIFYE